MPLSINLKGRLGNQLFQYATLRNISIKKGYNFHIDTNLKWHGQPNLLNYFNIKEPSPLGSITHHYSQPVNSNFYDSNINNINDNTTLDGHFENVEYFNENLDIIKDELTIKDVNINSRADNFMNEISKDGSKIVGVHFRRGDLIQQTHNVDEFIEKNKRFVYDSLESILKKDCQITLLIFTGGIRKKGGEGFTHYTHEDDLFWVEQFSLENESKFNIHISPGTIENNELLDYSLISKCDYLITPYQSTFSFMAYYLSNKDIKLYSPTNLYGGRMKIHITHNTLKKIISTDRGDGFGAQ